MLNKHKHELILDELWECFMVFKTMESNHAYMTARGLKSTNIYPNYLACLPKQLIVLLWNKWRWIRVPLHSLNLHISRMFWVKSSLIFRQLQSLDKSIRHSLQHLLTGRHDWYWCCSSNMKLELPAMSPVRQVKLNGDVIFYFCWCQQ